MATVYGYARCSTDESKQDISRQKRDLKALGVEDDANIYWEYESGAKTDRAELTKLLNIVEPGDTIVSTEVSRLTRSTKQLVDLIDLIQEKHLRLIAGSMDVDCRNAEIEPMTEAMLTVVGAFAQLERKMTSQRVKSGMANAKAKGKAIGRPKRTKERIPADFIEDYQLYKDGHIKLPKLIQLSGKSRSTVYRYIDTLEGRPVTR